jgi:hypothetical protein
VSPAHPLSPVVSVPAGVPPVAAYPAVRRQDPVRTATFAMLALVLLAIAVLIGLLAS